MPDVDTFGRSARRDTESKLHMTIAIAVATSCNGKVLYVPYELHGAEVNERIVMLLRVSKDKHLRKACGKYG